MALSVSRSTTSQWQKDSLTTSLQSRWTQMCLRHLQSLQRRHSLQRNLRHFTMVLLSIQVRTVSFFTSLPVDSSEMLQWQTELTSVNSTQSSRRESLSSQIRFTQARLQTQQERSLQQLFRQESAEAIQDLVLCTQHLRTGQRKTIHSRWKPNSSAMLTLMMRQVCWHQLTQLTLFLYQYQNQVQHLRLLQMSHLLRMH